MKSPSSFTPTHKSSSWDHFDITSRKFDDIFKIAAHARNASPALSKQRTSELVSSSPNLNYSLILKLDRVKKTNKIIQNIILGHPINLKSPSYMKKMHSEAVTSVWSFPKEQRFKQPKQLTQTPPYVAPMHSSSQVHISFPKSTRSFNYIHLGLDSPGPAAAAPKSLTRAKSTQQTFPKGRQKYQKTLYSEQRHTYFNFQNTPGPGYYEPPDPKKAEYSMKSKAPSRILQQSRDITKPAPNVYRPNHQSILSSRFSGIKIGRSKRSDIVNQKAISPGPGCYKLPSAFDKYKKRRKF